MGRHRIEIEFDSDDPDEAWGHIGSTARFLVRIGVISNLEDGMTPIVDDAPPVRISYLTEAEIESVRGATNALCGCERCRARRANTTP